MTNEMTKEEKLKRIIDKAVENGFDSFMFGIPEKYFFDSRGNTIFVYENNFDYYKTEINLIEIIFSKQFLKAFFGEKLPELKTRNGEIWYPTLPAWKYYAQELVLEDDKIDYLYKKI